jgi:hypothetical protein
MNHLHHQAQQQHLGKRAPLIKWRRYHDLLIHAQIMKWSAPIGNVEWTVEDEWKLKEMSQKCPCNDWNLSVQRKSNTWNDCQTDINSEEWDTLPQSTTKHQEQPIFLEPLTFQAQCFEQNLKNRKCPHGTQWYHASTECISCDIDILKEEQQLKENVMINVVENSSPPPPDQETSP